MGSCVLSGEESWIISTCWERGHGALNELLGKGSWCTKRLNTVIDGVKKSPSHIAVAEEKGTIQIQRVMEDLRWTIIFLPTESMYESDF